jgi:histidyl-tRNA synthetase
MGKKIQAVKGMNDLLPIEQKDFKFTSPPSGRLLKKL